MMDDDEIFYEDDEEDMEDIMNEPCRYRTRCR